MAIGDHKRVQNTVDYVAAQSQGPLNETRKRITEQGGDMWNWLSQGANNALTDYKGINNQYQQFLNPTQIGPSNINQGYGNLQDPATWMNLVSQPDQLKAWLAGSNPALAQLFQNNPQLADYYVKQIQGSPGANPTEQAGSAQYWVDKALKDPNIPGADPFRTGMTNAMSGYQNFAETGGFSPQDLENIRARSNAPIRGVYSQANAAVDKQRRLQGGYSPNYTAAKAKMAREQAYASADASTNTEAAIAQMLQQGKLAGLGGEAQVGTAGRNQNLGALQGQTSLYSATPGQAQVFGSLVGQNRNQDLEGQKLQQDIGKTMQEGRLGEAKVPGDFSQYIGNASDTVGLIGDIMTGGSSSLLKNVLPKKKLPVATDSSMY
jgi:hypothetical protein